MKPCPNPNDTGDGFDGTDEERAETVCPGATAEKYDEAEVGLHCHHWDDGEGCCRCDAPPLRECEVCGGRGEVVDLTVTMDDYNHLGERRGSFDQWLRGEGLNGPLHITEISMTGPRTARVVVPIPVVQRFAGGRAAHSVEITVHLTSDPPADVLAWTEAA